MFLFFFAGDTTNDEIKFCF